MKWINHFESVSSQKNIEIVANDILKLMAKRTMEINVIKQGDVQYVNMINGAYLPNLDMTKYDSELKSFILETKLGIVPQKDLKRGNNTHVYGSYNEKSSLIYLNVTNRLVEEINEKLNNPKVYGDKIVHYDEHSLYFTFWYEFRSTLIHELQHAWDAWKSKGKYTNTKRWHQYKTDYIIHNKEKGRDYEKDEKLFNDYLKLSHEINARFSQAIDKVKFWTIEMKPPFKDTKKPFKDVMKDFKLTFEGWREMDAPTQKRLLQRLYNFWVSDYKKREEKNTEE